MIRNWNARPRGRRFSVSAAAIARWSLLLVVGCAPGTINVGSTSTEPRRDTFQVNDVFGVAHPDQIVTFDCDPEIDRSGVRMLGPGDKEVSFQVLEDGQVALRIEGGLPEHEVRRFRTEPGIPHDFSTEPGAVTILDRGDDYEIDNGLVAVRIPKPVTNLVAEPIIDDLYIRSDLPPVPAPIQGLRYVDGTWTALGPNHVLTTRGLHTDGTSGPIHLPATAMQVEFVEEGPLRVVARVSYDVAKPLWEFWKRTLQAVDFDGDTIQLQPDHRVYRFLLGHENKPVVFSPDGDNPLPSPLQADRFYYARQAYDDHYTVHELDGTLIDLEGPYDGDIQRVFMQTVLPPGPGSYTSTITVDAGQPSIMLEDDTELDVQYDLDISEGLQPDQGRYLGANAGSVDQGYRVVDGERVPFLRRMDGLPNSEALVDLPFSHEPRLAIWDPWAANSGWYWALYAKDGSPESNLFGLFSGRASRAIDGHNRGPQIYSNSPDDTGIRVHIRRALPDSHVTERVRMEWGIFLGRKSDLGDLESPHALARQQNLHGGFSLAKLANYVLEVPSPPEGTQGIYANHDMMVRIIERLRTDEAYHDRLVQLDPPNAALWHALRDPTGEAASSVVSDILGHAHDIWDAYINGYGIYTHAYHYWMGGLNMTSDIIAINALQVLDELDDGMLDEHESRALRQALALYGYMLYDNDFVPMDNVGNFNMGTENMPAMYRGFRETVMTAAPLHETMAPRLPGFHERTLEFIRGSFNEYGASPASPGYSTVYLNSIFNMIAMLRSSTGINVAAEEPRLARVAEFYLQLQTPPEIRFGGLRKTVAMGDSPTQSKEVFGQMGSAFAGVDDELSERLMSMWHAGGAVHRSFFGTSFFKIDEELPVRDPALGDYDVPGYFSVFRDGWGSDRESAVWHVNGTFYRDHVNAELGAPVIYALGAPLSLLWGSVYTPRIAGAWMRNVVVAESRLNAPWTSSDVDMTNFFGFTPYGPAPVARAYESTAGQGRSAATFVMPGEDRWQREVTFDRRFSQPVIRIRDDFTGPWANEPKVFNLNLMAEGPVSTPGGTVDPPLGTTTASVTAPLDLSTGVHRLGFTGQWLNDWDVFVIANEPQRFYIGNWGHVSCPATEANQFRDANGRPFEERQHILRIRGTGRFEVVIVPFRKGARPADLAVNSGASGVTVTMDGNSLPLD